MASVWPPQQRDNEEPHLVNVAPIAQSGYGQPVYQQPQQNWGMPVQPPPQQTWGMPAPMPVPEETKDYGYNRPGDGDRPGPFLADEKHNWSKAPSRRSFKIDGEPEVASSKYQDLWAAVLFLGHLAVICWVAFTKGLKLLKADANHTDNATDVGANIENNSIVLLSVGCALCTLVAAIISFGAIRIMMNHARSIITFMLMGSVVMQVVVAVAAFFAGLIWLFIMGLVFAAIGTCYYYMVRSRIPFAATNLAVACAALKRSSGPMAAAFGLMLVQLVWQFVWVLAMLGVVVPHGGYSIEYQDKVYATDECHNYVKVQGQPPNCLCQHPGEKAVIIPGECRVGEPGGGLIFVMLISFFWGSMVIQNLGHCTVAGVVAEWYLNGTQTASSTWASFKRAATTSFGSICFGSLIVAVVKAVHQMALEAKQSKNSTVVALAECLLSMLESAVEYFNRYAFIEVAMYGKSFMASGKAAMDLFRSRGLTAVVNDQLVSSVFMLGCLTCSVMCALFGYLFGVGLGINRDYLVLLVGLGFLLGLVVSSIVMNVIDSAVATVFVCWAEAGDALERTNRELFLEMSEAWAKFQAPTNQV